MLPDEQTSPEQIAALRAMTGQARLKVAERLFWMARRVTLAGVRARHPDWPEDKIKAEADQLLLHAGD